MMVMDFFSTPGASDYHAIHRTLSNFQLAGSLQPMKLVDRCHPSGLFLENFKTVPKPSFIVNVLWVFRIYLHLLS